MGRVMRTDEGRLGRHVGRQHENERNETSTLVFAVPSANALHVLHSTPSVHLHCSRCGCRWLPSLSSRYHSDQHSLRIINMLQSL